MMFFTPYLMDENALRSHGALVTFDCEAHRSRRPHHIYIGAPPFEGKRSYVTVCGISMFGFVFGGVKIDFAL